MISYQIIFFKLNELIKTRLTFLLLIILFLNSCSNKSLKFEYDGQIYMKTIINDTVQGNFIYDTGARYSCLDKTFISKNTFAFNDVKKISVYGVGNEIQVLDLVKDALLYSTKISTCFSMNNIIIDLKSILGRKVDGILGVETFINNMHKIDFIKRKITFTNKLLGYNKINIKQKDKQIFVPLKINTFDEREIEGDFLLDLGSSTTNINSNVINLDGFARKIKFISNGGVGGNSAGFTFFVENINFGDNIIINKFPIDNSIDEKGALSSKEYIGILGTDLLDDFHIILDLKNNFLFLKPNNNFNKGIKTLFKSFSVIDRTDLNKGWIVSSIYESSDAYKAGLRTNDEIKTINGISVNKIKLKKFIKKLELNQKFNLEVFRNNKKIKIEFVLNILLDGK